MTIMGSHRDPSIVILTVAETSSIMEDDAILAKLYHDWIHTLEALSFRLQTLNPEPLTP